MLIVKEAIHRDFGSVFLKKRHLPRRGIYYSREIPYANDYFPPREKFLVVRDFSVQYSLRPGPARSAPRDRLLNKTAGFYSSNKVIGG
jgi:hypothetical protein